MNAGSDMKILAILLSLFLTEAAYSCSPPFDNPVEFDAAAAYAGELAPKAPVARVVGIKRGRPAKRGDNSCVEISSVTVAVRDDSPRVPYYFSFRELGGTAPDLIFQEGIRDGDLDGAGDLYFTFYWPEISRELKPIDLRVEITPFTRSGMRGPGSELRVQEVRPD